jgi:hypothetical protein
MYKILPITALLFLLQSCSGNRAVPEDTAATLAPVPRNKVLGYAAGPHAIVYKTVKDYADKVPVIMDKNRVKIVSYPAPSDVYYNGNLAKPAALKNGYLLDNRGINKDVAFLEYTYEEYSQLKEAPSMSELLAKIIDKEPLQIMFDCGLRSQYRDEAKELNQLIDSDFEGLEPLMTRTGVQ